MTKQPPAAPAASLVDRIADQLAPAVLERVLDRVVAGIGQRLGIDLGGAPAANDARPAKPAKKPRPKAAAPTPPKAAPDVKRAPAPAARAAGPACSKCGKPGHNARSCGRTPKGSKRPPRAKADPDDHPAPVVPSRIANVPLAARALPTRSGPQALAQRMIALAREGVAPKEIAAATGRHISTVTSQLRKHAPGLIPPARTKQVPEPRPVRSRVKVVAMGQGENSGIDHDSQSRAQVDAAIALMDEVGYFDPGYGFEPCRDEHCVNEGGPPRPVALVCSRQGHRAAHHLA